MSVGVASLSACRVQWRRKWERPGLLLSSPPLNSADVKAVSHPSTFICGKLQGGFSERDVARGSPSWPWVSGEGALEGKGGLGPCGHCWTLALAGSPMFFFPCGHQREDK